MEVSPPHVSNRRSGLEASPDASPASSWMCPPVAEPQAFQAWSHSVEAEWAAAKDQPPSQSSDAEVDPLAKQSRQDRSEMRACMFGEPERRDMVNLRARIAEEDAARDARRAEVEGRFASDEQVLTPVMGEADHTDALDDLLPNADDVVEEAWPESMEPSQPAEPEGLEDADAAPEAVDQELPDVPENGNRSQLEAVPKTEPESEAEDLLEAAQEAHPEEPDEHPEEPDEHPLAEEAQPSGCRKRPAAEDQEDEPAPRRPRGRGRGRGNGQGKAAEKGAGKDGKGKGKGNGKAPAVPAVPKAKAKADAKAKAAPERKSFGGSVPPRKQPNKLIWDVVVSEWAMAPLREMRHEGGAVKAQRDLFMHTKAEVVKQIGHINATQLSQADRDEAIVTASKLAAAHWIQKRFLELSEQGASQVRGGHRR